MTEGDKNLMDELRHVQLLLKREEIFNEFQANEVQELNTKLRKESQNVFNLQKLLLYLHMISMGNRAIELSPKFFDSLLKEIPEKLSQPPQGASLSAPNIIISKFLENNELLAKSCIKLINEHPDKLDQLAFSTLPGLFGYLWSAESGEKFANFMKVLIEIDSKIAQGLVQVIYGLPPFRQFFDAVVSDLIYNIKTVKDEETADQFAQCILNKWRENAQFCPDIICQVISYSKNPVEFLAESFIKPAFQSPRTFGIIPLSYRLNNDSMNLIMNSLLKITNDLWESLKNVSNPSTLFSAKKLSEILPDLGKTVLLTSEDLEVLGILAKNALSIDNTFPDKPIYNDNTKSEFYQVYSFTSPSSSENQKNIPNEEQVTENDDIEKQLREMLIGVDVIPLAAQSNTTIDMISLLKSQVQLARPDNRLLLEMKIDDFESAHNKREEKMNFNQFLDLLNEKFKERTSQRLEKLSKISSYNTEYTQMEQLSKSLKKTILEYSDLLRLHLVEKWLREIGKLNCSDELCTDSSKFSQFFYNFVEQWNNWCKSHGYVSKTNHEILHNIVMNEIPLERFLELNPKLIQEDKEIHDGIIEKKEELLRQNTFDFTSTFQENPKLLEPAQLQLKQAFDTPLPLLKLQYFQEALDSLVFVLTFEGHKEVGADQWLPMAILLLVLAEPERLPSNINYIEHFVKLNEGEDFEIHLIPEQRDYIFTMVKSALLHFEKSIKGSEE